MSCSSRSGLKRGEDRTVGSRELFRSSVILNTFVLMTNICKRS